MPDPSVHPSEKVSRFLIEGDIRVKDDSIRRRAFLPSASSLEISVFRIYQLSDDAIWTLAVEKVEPQRGPVLGRGDLSVEKIIENKLQVVPDMDAASRHADIVGWSQDRDLRATIAMELARLASPAKKRASSTV
jgi:hypothetical protein